MARVRRSFVWVYAYEIVPPVSKGRLDPIRALVDHECAVARTETHTVAGRLVQGRRVTRILIVSWNPGQEHELDHALAAELGRLHATFAVTDPIEVPAGPPESAARGAQPGNGR
jgi:hypothetical protein